jgi:hypothetical protein
VFNKMSKSQRGFIPGFSVIDNLYDVLGECFKVRQKYKGIVLFIDLAKAYDNVDRRKLMHVLEDFGVPGNLVNLIW